VHAAIKAFLPEIANTMEKKFTTSLGMGIGTRRLVAKVMAGSAAEVNDVRVGDVVLEVAGQEVLATMRQAEITALIAAAMKKDGEVVIKFGRAEAAEGDQDVLPEPQRNVNSLMDLMLRAGQGLARKTEVTQKGGFREAKRIVHVSCKHPITELSVDLVVSEHGGGGEYVTGAPPTVEEAAEEDGAGGGGDGGDGGAAVGEEDEEENKRSLYTTPSNDEENRKQLDEAVTLLTANLQPVHGTTGAVSEGATKFPSLGGNVVLRVAVGSLDAMHEDAEKSSPPKDLPPVLTKEGSMTEMRMLSISETSSTHSLTKRMSMEVMQSAAVAAGM
jgi:hypothetical protein